MTSIDKISKHIIFHGNDYMNPQHIFFESNIIYDPQSLDITNSKDLLERIKPFLYYQ